LALTLHKNQITLTRSNAPLNTKIPHHQPGTLKAAHSMARNTQLSPPPPARSQLFLHPRHQTTSPIAGIFITTWWSMGWWNLLLIGSFRVCIGMLGWVC